MRGFAGRRYTERVRSESFELSTFEIEIKSDINDFGHLTNPWCNRGVSERPTVSQPMFVGRSCSNRPQAVLHSFGGAQIGVLVST
jgi:hypothetical protein